MRNAASQPAGRVRADNELKLESARPGVDRLESLAHLFKSQINRNLREFSLVGTFETTEQTKVQDAVLSESDVYSA
jgi:hypothetical protein